ncbi:regulator of G-protein signaling 21 isoform X1 [Boleophthalmus pectinirostris]|uniref:regulator of G-protein signaling 21 isoform X1 n=1 Tax=Boleophthalmus pectinirostris TaxID=150288 RepID=UPI00242B763F|nr:regulator of G-protein signaling 21 isoform X1 [Boleophthalmus pectinirostris]
MYSYTYTHKYPNFFVIFCFRAKGMRVKLSHLADKNKSVDGKTPHDLDALLSNKNTLHVFRCFLRSEFSEENLDFWLACEEYRISPMNVKKSKACGIYNQFINPDAPQEVNLDAETREALLSLMDSPSSDTFNIAQQKIFNLMAKDSFPRFLRSTYCMETIRAY